MANKDIFSLPLVVYARLQWQMIAIGKKLQ
jgi:hypothetical protein